MKARRFGRIVNVASAHGLTASPFKSAYVAAKHGLLGLSKTVALEFAEFGITSNTICPGYVKTPLVDKQIADQAKAHGISPEQVVRDVMLVAPGDQAVRAGRGTGRARRVPRLRRRRLDDRHRARDGRRLDAALNPTPSGGTMNTFAEQVVALRPMLVRVARQRLRNDAWAEDAVSETLVAALENPGAFTGRASAAHLAGRHPEAQGGRPDAAPHARVPGRVLRRRDPSSASCTTRCPAARSRRMPTGAIRRSAWTGASSWRSSTSA